MRLLWELQKVLRTTRFEKRRTSTCTCSVPGMAFFSCVVRRTCHTFFAGKVHLSEVVKNNHKKVQVLLIVKTCQDTIGNKFKFTIAWKYPIFPKMDPYQSPTIIYKEWIVKNWVHFFVPEFILSENLFSQTDVKDDIIIF